MFRQTPRGWARRQCEWSRTPRVFQSLHRRGEEVHGWLRNEKRWLDDDARPASASGTAQACCLYGGGAAGVRAVSSFTERSGAVWQG